VEQFRGTISASWNNFFSKKRFDFIFFAVILRAFFVEQFAHRGTICHAKCVSFVKIFYDFLVVFIHDKLILFS
jgi:hypothetical protein